MTQRTLTKQHYQRLEKIIADDINFIEDVISTINHTKAFYYDKADKADISSDSKNAFIVLNHAKTNQRFFKKKLKKLVELQGIIKANIK